MLAAKREWIYSGLAVPPGLALVRPVGPRAPVAEGSSVLLCGSSVTTALAVPLGALARGDGVDLHVLAEDGTDAADWSKRPGFPGYLRRLKPAAVLYVLSPEDRRAVKALTLAARSAGAEVRWLAPPGARLSGEGIVPAPIDIDDPAGQMSVGMYAAWAGAAWKSLAQSARRR